MRSSAGTRSVSVALPPSFSPCGAYSLRPSTRPPDCSVIRTASRAASIGLSTFTVTQPVVMTWRSRSETAVLSAPPPSCENSVLCSEESIGACGAL